MTPTEEIKNKLDIVEFVRSYLPLQPAGKNFKALCPFHKEKTPSFIVSPERQTWHCFGACSEGGDIFKFLMKQENLEFHESLRFLAEKAGVELKRINPAEQQQFGVLYDINNSAKEFFKQQLRKFPAVIKYLAERGLKNETIEEFELGFAPDNKDVLTLDLIRLGHRPSDIERAGLNFKNDRGGYVDRFRGRLMFPVYNHFGKTVGFSGRILPQFDNGELGKYINSPETPIFNKSRMLYGFHKSKKHIREAQMAVLVEGQMDFLMMYQDGIKNAVATSGTALTAEHLKSLRRLTDQIILSFDSDEAGMIAAERSIDLAHAADFNTRVLIIDNYKDPAEAVCQSPGLVASLINQVKPAMEFYFDRYLQKKDFKEKGGDIFKIKINIRSVLEKIKKLASAVEKNHWLKELAIRTSFEEKVLAEEMERINSATSYSSRFDNKMASMQLVPVSRRELIAQRLLSLLIARNDLRAQINEHENYLPETYLLILKSLIAQTQLMQQQLIELHNLLSLRSTFEIQVLGEDKIENEFQELLKQLRVEYLKEKRQTLTNILKEAEKDGDEQKTISVLKEIDEVSRLMHN